MKICHRDLKPQNILVAPGDIPKIVDFNSVAFPAQKTITYPAASAIPGTLAYFSPELAAARSGRDSDPDQGALCLRAHG